VAIRLKLSAVSKAKAMFSIGAYKKALAKAIELDPQNVDARTEQIGYLIYAPGIAGGDVDTARSKIAELEVIDRRQAMQMLAELEQHEEHPDAAIEAYRALLENDPDDAESRFGMAYLLQRQERWQEADEQLAILESHPSPRMALNARYQRARTRVLGRYEQETAVEMLLAHLESLDADLKGVSPRWAALWRLGNAHEQIGRADEARAVYQEALTLEPGNEQITDSLANLD